MKIFKWVLVTFSIAVIFAVYHYYQEFGDLFSSTNIIELRDNWIERKSDILFAKNFFNEVTPPGYTIKIEFCRNSKINLSIYELNQTARDGRILWFQAWDIDYENYIIPKPTKWDSLDSAPITRSLDVALKKINWNIATINQLKQKLRNANCITVESGEPTKIGFRRSSLGLYSYDIFSSSIPIEKKSYYNDSLQYIYYSDSLVFEYGGGAFGRQSFPDFTPQYHRLNDK